MSAAPERKMYTHMGHTHEVQWPHLTDTEIAHTVRMLMRTDLNHEAVVCAARDRLLYLVDRVKKLEATGLDERQRVVVEWGARCFGAEHMADAVVRSARHLEKAVELGQAVGLTKEHAQRVLDHVYSRPAGDPAQEIGRSANTLMAVCGALGLSFDECQKAEIHRVLSKDPAHFAARNEAKLKEVDADPTHCKPHHGRIEKWHRELCPWESGKHLGYYIMGTLLDHPRIAVKHTNTSAVFKYDVATGEIETRNSRYTLIGPATEEA